MCTQLSAAALLQFDAAEAEWSRTPDGEDGDGVLGPGGTTLDCFGSPQSVMSLPAPDRQPMYGFLDCSLSAQCPPTPVSIVHYACLPNRKAHSFREAWSLPSVSFCVCVSGLTPVVSSCHC